MPLKKWVLQRLSTNSRYIVVKFELIKTEMENILERNFVNFQIITAISYLNSRWNTLPIKGKDIRIDWEQKYKINVLEKL